MPQHNIGLIGDQSESVQAHLAIPHVIHLAEEALPEYEFSLTWIPTKSITNSSRHQLQSVDRLWCVPGSPYENMEGALRAIRYARENHIPFLGSCGGFQHALLEYARNVLGLAEADHEESNPIASKKIISRLSCSLYGETEKVTVVAGTKLSRICARSEMLVKYFCNFGFNAQFKSFFPAKEFVFSAYDSQEEVRAFELVEHPFFVGVLFQPELEARDGVLHPLLREFLTIKAGEHPKNLSDTARQ